IFKRGEYRLGAVEAVSNCVTHSSILAPCTYSCDVIDLNHQPRRTEDHVRTRSKDLLDRHWGAVLRCSDPVHDHERDSERDRRWHRLHRRTRLRFIRTRGILLTFRYRGNPPPLSEGEPPQRGNGAVKRHSRLVS